MELHLQDSKEAKMTDESEMSTEVMIYLQEDKGVGNVLWEIVKRFRDRTRNSNFPLYSRVSQSACDALSVRWPCLTSLLCFPRTIH